MTDARPENGIDHQFQTERKKNTRLIWLGGEMPERVKNFFEKQENDD